MPIAMKPENESQRLETLRRLLILDSTPESPFEAIVRVLKRVFDTQFVAISLVDEDRQWFAACAGLDVKETSRDIAFCSHAVFANQVLHVPDATQDERFCDNPLVLDGTIRFYLGSPLVVPTGECLGTVCVFDGEIRHATAEQIELIKDVAGLVIDVLMLRYDSIQRRHSLARLDDLEQVIHQRNRELEHAATHDSLTGLLNREGLHQAMVASLNSKSIPQADHSTATLCFDLDRFKIVNDSLGHAAGDVVLKTVTQRCIDVLTQAQADGVIQQWHGARPGGDEFVLQLEGLTHASAVDAITEQLLDAIRRPIDLDGHVFFTTASVGVVTCETCASACADPASLLRNADAAMYAAKDQGKDCAVTFDDSMHARMAQRMQREVQLHQAIDEGEFRLEYQPIVGVHDARIEGCEALLRWDRPGEGLVSPVEFVPIAEETGLIGEIGNWVLHDALQQLATWRREGVVDDTFYVSINLSKRQLIRPTIIDEIECARCDAGLQPSDFKLEITESVVIECPGVVTQTLHKLREMGYHFSMDDFGTGQSSLNCIHEFPVDVIKIDRAFIENLKLGAHFTAVVQSIITLASNLGMKVVAEGIETLEQLTQVQALDCDSAQGYFFAKPLRPEAFVELMDRPTTESFGKLKCA